MKVGLVINGYDAHGGGAERWTDCHARMLLAQGHEVHLLSRRFRGAPDEATCHVVDVPRLWPVGRLTDRLRFARCVEAMLPALRLDVVHDMGDGWRADLFMPHHGTRRGGLRHKSAKLSPILRGARHIAERIVPRYLEFDMLERRQFDSGGGVNLYLAVSQMIADQMQALYGLAPERIRVVHNGVDTRRFRPDDGGGAGAQTRIALGVEPDEVLYLIVALDFRRKGVDPLLRAMARMVAAGRPAKLVVVGDGPIGRYQAFARSLDCESAVRFVGDQPDPIPYYEAADAFVLPTFYDPCSLVALEAMASGLPTITSEANGVHEIMTPGREGEVLAEAGDVDALVVAMERYLDPAERAEVGRAARALAEEHSIERMFARHLEVYEEIVARRRAEETGAEAANRPRQGFVGVTPEARPAGPAP